MLLDYDEMELKDEKIKGNVIVNKTMLLFEFGTKAHLKFVLAAVGKLHQKTKRPPLTDGLLPMTRENLTEGGRGCRIAVNVQCGLGHPLFLLNHF